MDPLIAEHRLKHMVSWDRDPILCQEDIDMLLLAARRVDPSGTLWSEPGWVATYALDWAAREAWAWKSGAAVDRYKVVSDGTELSRQMVFEHCQMMTGFYAKRAANEPHSIRARGNLLEDRQGIYSTIPWWWEASA